MKPEHDIAATVRSALQAGQDALHTSSDSARLDAELLLGHVLERPRAWLYAHPDEPVPPATLTVFLALLGQRASGRPLAHLTGIREFWSLELGVNEHTLVPRPETELLVERALAHMPAGSTGRALDLGTGSGAIAIALATERPGWDIVATERSPAALATARDNAARHAPDRISFCAGDWFGAVAAKPAFDVIVSNPPYIATRARELTDPELAFEPTAALYSGADGLDAIKTIVAAAGPALCAGGWLALEHGYDQADAVTELLTAAGFSSLATHADLAGLPRVTEGCRSTEPLRGPTP